MTSARPAPCAEEPAHAAGAFERRDPEARPRRASRSRADLNPAVDTTEFRIGAFNGTYSERFTVNAAGRAWRCGAYYTDTERYTGYAVTAP
jgi:hypothetical protein